MGFLFFKMVKEIISIEEFTISLLFGAFIGGVIGAIIGIRIFI